MSKEAQSCGKGVMELSQNYANPHRRDAGRVRWEMAEASRSVEMAPEVRLAARFAARPALREAQQARVERY
jgi:hypothetical protein